MGTNSSAGKKENKSYLIAIKEFAKKKSEKNPFSLDDQFK
jgi:hypothetical protein